MCVCITCYDMPFNIMFTRVLLYYINIIQLTIDLKNIKTIQLMCRYYSLVIVTRSITSHFTCFLKLFIN